MNSSFLKLIHFNSWTIWSLRSGLSSKARPLQTRHHYYGPVRPCVSHRYSGSHGAATWTAPSLWQQATNIETTGSQVTPLSLKRTHATFTPDTVLTVSGSSSALIPG